MYVSSDHVFRCSLCNSKKSFYRAFNCIYGKIGGVAPVNVIMELLKTKCLPCLYYALEACPVNKSLMNSLEFVVNGVIRKILSTKSNDVVNVFLYFNCVACDATYRRKIRFLNKFKHSNNSLCSLMLS